MYVEYTDEKSGNNNEVSQPFSTIHCPGYYVIFTVFRLTTSITAARLMIKTVFFHTLLWIVSHNGLG
jgi:hypothetical protein